MGRGGGSAVVVTRGERVGGGRKDSDDPLVHCPVDSAETLCWALSASESQRERVKRDRRGPRCVGPRPSSFLPLPHALTSLIARGA